MCIRDSSKGFTYCIPPFIIQGNVVEGVMRHTAMDAMMYKIEGEDLYLSGTSEHSMIGRFIDQIIPSDKRPQTLTSYSPCFRKEKGSHGIEARGVYRLSLIHIWSLPELRGLRRCENRYRPDRRLHEKRRVRSLRTL